MGKSGLLSINIGEVHVVMSWSSFRSVLWCFNPSQFCIICFELLCTWFYIWPHVTPAKFLSQHFIDGPDCYSNSCCKGDATWPTGQGLHYSSECAVPRIWWCWGPPDKVWFSGYVCIKCMHCWHYNHTVQYHIVLSSLVPYMNYTFVDEAKKARKWRSLMWLMRRRIRADQSPRPIPECVSPPTLILPRWTSKHKDLP